MASLQDTIRANLTGQNTAPEQRAGAATDNTGALQSMLAARGGKAVEGGAPTPRLSNVQEQVQQNLAKVQQEQQQQAGATQATQVEQANQGQQQQMSQQMQQVDQSRVESVDKFTAESDRLLRDFQQQGQQINFQKDAAKLEQLGFNLRLSDEKYVNQLKMAGTKARLDNANNFEYELSKSVFADEQELFNSNLQFKSLMSAKGRDFERELSNIDIETALQVAATNANAANSATLWTGLGNTVSAGISAYGTYAKSQTKAGNTGLTTGTAGGGGTGGLRSMENVDASWYEPEITPTRTEMKKYGDY